MEKYNQKSLIEVSRSVLQLTPWQKGVLSLSGLCITMVLFAIIRTILPQETVIQPTYNNMLEEYLALIMQYAGYLLLLFIIMTSFFFGQTYGERKKNE